MISTYIPDALLESVKERICSELGTVLNGNYRGPFGVDMMVCASQDNNGFLLHPCVEINLRRTMGHVALSLSPTDDDVRRVMRIDYTDNNYLLKLIRI